MKQQELKQFLYELNNYVPKNELEEQQKAFCLEKMQSITCINSMKEIDLERLLEMKHILEKQPSFLSYAIFLSTLISLVDYNIAIISYSKEEIFLAIQAFKDILPSDYAIYDNQKIPLLSNRMYLGTMIEKYSLQGALNVIPEYLDGCEVSYQMGVTK